MVEYMPLAQVVILGSWDRVLHQAPCGEYASPSSYVSTFLCVFLMNKLKYKIFLKRGGGQLGGSVVKYLPLAQVVILGSWD